MHVKYEGQIFFQAAVYGSVTLNRGLVALAPPTADFVLCAKIRRESKSRLNGGSEEYGVKCHEKKWTEVKQKQRRQPKLISYVQPGSKTIIQTGEKKNNLKIQNAN